MHHKLLLALIFLSSFQLNAYAIDKSSKLVGSKLSFEEYNINAPFSVSLPVIAIDIIKNDELPHDELVVIGENDSKQTWLAVYSFNEKDNSFFLVDQMPLTNEYFAYDVSESDDGLYFLAKNKVVSLVYHGENKKDNKDSSTFSLEHFQSVNSIFLVNESSFITKKNFIQDINKDGKDDIVLADFEQTNLWLSSVSAEKADYQKISISAEVELNRGDITFKPTKLFLADFNLDNKQDIAWISKGNINYFSQKADGKFTSEQQKITLADTIYGLNWWEITESDGQGLDQSNLTHRVVEEIKDINGDGLADVVVRFTKSSGVLDRANDYEFYFGFVSNKTNQLTYSVQADTVIQADGTLTGLKIIDVNEDKKFEVLLSSFELSVSNIIGALLSGGIDQNVLLFALNDGGYEEDPLISKEVELSFSLTSGQSGQPIVLLSDVNGDKIQDLILSSGEEKVSIYLGNSSSGLFNRKASKHEILLPKNGALFENHDINHDGKEDIIMRYGRLDEDSMANKVTILLVK